jgi:hypothetical protein
MISKSEGKNLSWQLAIAIKVVAFSALVGIVIGWLMAMHWQPEIALRLLVLKVQQIGGLAIPTANALYFLEKGFRFAATGALLGGLAGAVLLAIFRVGKRDSNGPAIYIDRDD